MATKAQLDLSAALAIPGWMKPPELAWLADHAAEATAILELGAYRGRSTRALADHALGTVTVIDSWEGEYADASPAFQANLADHLESGRVVVYRADAEEMLTTLGQRGEQFDLIFIDANHDEAGVRSQIALAVPLLWHDAWRMPPVLCGHDYGDVHHPGVKAAVDALFPTGVQTCGSIWWVP